MVKQILKIVHLYPREMNIYGDNGNTLVIRRRVEWRGMGAEIIAVGVGDDLPNDVDMIISGGGQDKGQIKVEKDLQSRKAQLSSMASDGVAMLLICGTYQLFGHRFITHNQESINGIGILDIETHAGPQRLIGNIVTDSDHGRLVGYENHSGLTFVGSGSTVFGSVVSGSGNNGQDGSEGAVSNNVFGTYLHGPILPKNPHFADVLIKKAVNRKFGTQELQPLDDGLEETAHLVAVKRPR